jgi:hypothetical protein
MAHEPDWALAVGEVVSGKLILRARDARIVIADTIASIRRGSRGWPSYRKVTIDL